MNFGGGSFDSKFKVLVPFLRVKIDVRATIPHTLFSANASNQCFEITISFNLKIIQQCLLDCHKPQNPRGKGFNLCQGFIYLLRF